MRRRRVSLSRMTLSGSELLERLWHVGEVVNAACKDERRSETLAAKKDANLSIGQQMTAAALKSVKALEAFLDANPVEIYAKGTSREAGDQPASTTARNCVVQTAVPTDVYVRMVNHAATTYPGALKGGALAEGFLPRTVRYAVLPIFSDINAEDLDAWEDARATASSKARGERMRGLQAEVKEAKKDRDTLAKINERRARNPELDALLSAMEAEDNNA